MNFCFLKVLPRIPKYRQNLVIVYWRINHEEWKTHIAKVDDRILPINEDLYKFDIEVPVCLKRVRYG
jgi:hypothetical protein